MRARGNLKKAGSPTVRVFMTVSEPTFGCVPESVGKTLRNACLPFSVGGDKSGVQTGSPAKQPSRLSSSSHGITLRHDERCSASPQTSRPDKRFATDSASMLACLGSAPEAKLIASSSMAGRSVLERVGAVDSRLDAR